MIEYDYLIVGSGLFGATFAHFAAKVGKRCLVIDKREHLGGNVYCEPYYLGAPTETNDSVSHGESRSPERLNDSLIQSVREGAECVNVHKYGAHIFHTSNKEVWDFVNSIVPFNRYTNCPVANYHGELYNLPFNMNTFCQMWPDVHTPEEAKARIEEQKAEAVAALAGREPANLEEQALCLVGKDIFTKLIKEYTEKQWGRSCKDLPAFIIRRLPVRFVFDNNYFNDKYQGIPEGGYNVLINGLLEGVDCVTGVDFNRDTWEKIINEDWCSIGGDWRSKKIKETWQEVASHLVYTGAIDEYFDYRLGRLDWRTVSFKTRIEDTPNYQGNAVINYTSHEQPYTRVIEHKHFEMFGQQVYDCPQTVISEEYSTEYKPGMEMFYPVNDDKNNILADKYRTLAAQEENVIFGGRLAEYKYYDMAPIIEMVMKYWRFA